MDLDEYQRRSAETDVRPNPDDMTYPLLGLAGEVGELLARHKKRLREASAHDLTELIVEDLGDILWYTAAVARTAGVSLSEVASRNLVKTSEAFGPVPASSQYDDGYPPHEQLPRRFEVSFVPDLEGNRVRMFVGSDQIGDPLDDNAREEDHYRFHDAFHLAHAAVLGWSPMLRRALGRKRKSVPDTDRVEDGARAIFVEEAVIAYLFARAEEVDFFERATRVEWDLIKTLRHMTSHLEVATQPPAAWQSMILQGFSAWRLLRAQGGGHIVADLDERTLCFTNQQQDLRSFETANRAPTRPPARSSSD